MARTAGLIGCGPSAQEAVGTSGHRPAHSAWSAALGAVLALALGAGALGAEPPPASGAAGSADKATGKPEKDQIVSRPEASGRVVRFFDFEERADPSAANFNPEPVPVGWFRAQHAPPIRERPGFPQANRAGYDTSVAHSGRVSIKLPTSGGSTALRLSGSALPVFPNADYMASAFVRTDGVRDARAFLFAQFLDGSGKPIPGSERRSAPIVSPNAWTPVTVQLSGAYAGAAFVQVELQLLQPELFLPPPVAPEHHVWAEDRAAAAWFDDLGVYQAPKVSLVPGGVDGGTAMIVSREAPPPPLMTATVRDLTGEPMRVKLTLRDLDERVLATDERMLGAGGGQFEWSPKLPRPGWYRADMELYTSDILIGSRRTQFVWARPLDLAALGIPTPTGRQAERFSVAISRFQPGQYASLPELLHATGAGAVTIPLWPAGEEAAEDPAGPLRRAFRAMIDSLLAENKSITLWLSAISGRTAGALRLDPGDPLALVTQGQKDWLPTLRSVLDQYGQRINQWQIGSAQQRDTLLRADLGKRIGGFREILSKLVPGPQLVLPWQAEWGWPGAEAGAALDSLAMTYPVSYSASAATQTVKAWSEQSARSAAGQSRLTVNIETLPLDVYGPRAQAIDLAQRAISLWAALPSEGEGHAAVGGGANASASAGGGGGGRTGANGATAGRVITPRATSLGRMPPRLQLTDPVVFDADGAGVSATALPEASVAVWRSLVTHLAPRRAVGELPAPAGVRCIIFADANPASQSDASSGVTTGALALWAETPEGQGAPITAYLGLGRLHSVDLFGNVTPLEAADAAGKYRIAAREMPVFIEGIDPNLALFIQGFRIEPDFVPAVAAEHEHELVVTNPWPVRVTGEVLLVPPSGTAGQRAWRFTPTSGMPIALGPGETQRLPFAFAFSAAEEAGPRQISAIVKLTADRVYPPLRISAPITIGLRDLELLPTAMLGPTPTGPDVIVTATVVNTGSTTRTLQLDVAAPEHAPQRQPVSNLGPGETAVRRFGFPGSAAGLSGKRVRITLSDADGNERLNKVVAVP